VKGTSTRPISEEKKKGRPTPSLGNEERKRGGKERRFSTPDELQKPSHRFVCPAARKKEGNGKRVQSEKGKQYQHRKKKRGKKEKRPPWRSRGLENKRTAVSATFVGVRKRGGKNRLSRKKKENGKQAYMFPQRGER